MVRKSAGWKRRALGTNIFSAGKTTQNHQYGNQRHHRSAHLFQICIHKSLGDYAPIDADSRPSSQSGTQGGAFKSRRTVNTRALPAALFLSFAQVWCQNQGARSARQSAAGDPQSPRCWRVNGASQNSDDGKSFGGTTGARMYPVNSCRVW